MIDLLKPGWQIPATALILGLLICPAAPAVGGPLALSGALMLAVGGIFMALYGIICAVEWATFKIWAFLDPSVENKPATL